MTGRGVDLRLAIPAVSGWVLCWLLVAHPRHGVATAVVCGAVAVCAILVSVVLRRGHGGLRSERWVTAVATLVVAAAACGLLATSVAVHAEPRRPAMAVAAAQRGEPVDLRLTVESPPATTSDAHGGHRVGFRANLTSVTVRSGSDGAGRLAPAHAPVIVSIPADELGTGDGGDGEDRIALRLGMRLSMDARLITHPPSDGTAFFVEAASDVRELAPPPAMLAWSDELRDRFQRLAARLPGDGGDLLAGLAIGDVRGVSDGLDAAMKAASLSHLTAVSGSNCAVIVTMVALGAAACGAGRRLRAAAALTALAAFVMLVTPGASVLRAAVMAVIAVGSQTMGRRVAGLPVLSAAVMALLCLDPWMARDYGFALSVFATAGLVLLAPLLARAMPRRIPSRWARLLAVPLAAQLFCQPVLILLDPGIPLYGVAANLLAEPAAPIATVLGLLSCLLLPVVPGLAQGCAQVAWVPSAWIAAVARFCAGAPGAQLPWPAGLPGALLAVLVVVFVVALVAGIRMRRRMGRILAVAAAVALLLVGGGYAGAVGARALDTALTRPDQWQIAACDVGQGDALMLHSEGVYALIDTGPETAPLAACLRKLGVRHIGLLVLTHYDEDHVGGLDAVLDMVGTALVGPPGRASDRARLRSLLRAGVRVRQAFAGDHGTLGALHWRVLWPIHDSSGLDPSGNEQSVTLSVTGGGIRSIFLGDLDERAQARLLDRGVIRHVDVVKVAHHGSADQSAALYRALDARVGLISVGAHNDYGHPTPTALHILESTGTTVLRTDQKGTILLDPQKDGTIRTWASGPG